MSYTERPTWASDEMNDGDIEFISGYMRAIEWLPTATPDALKQEITTHRETGCFDPDWPLGLDEYRPGAYSVGFATALKAHRSREIRIVELRDELAMLESQPSELH
jgi:hypothetical protein